MRVKEEIKERYDGFAEKIDKSGIERIRFLHNEVSPVTKYFRKRKIETALQLGRFIKGSKILEIGSNVGQNTTMLAKEGLQMIGIDISDKAVEVARKNAQALNLKNIKYFPADAENLSLFDNETFDGVVSFSTLRYVPNLKQALGEIYRVTKKGGIAVLDFPNKDCPWFALLKNKFGVENHIHDNFFTKRGLIKLFNEIGFKNVETKKILFTHYTFKPEFLGLYKIIDSIGENTWLLREFAAIILCKGIKL